MITSLYYNFLGFLFSRPKIKTLTWKYWYPYITRRLKETNVVFLNYAYIDDTTGPETLKLETEDEPNRACISLYHHLARQVDLKGKQMLEISCGHGGGASFVSRYHKPAQLIAVDLNPEGIGFCKKRHPLPNLEFIRANAERIPLMENSVDVVINVEASHSYGDFSTFLNEVERVLKPGGYFLYTDFRGRKDLTVWEKELLRESFKVIEAREINPEVVRGMDKNSNRSSQLIDNALPFYLRSIGKLFAGVKGTRIYSGLAKNNIIYRSWCLQRV